MSDSKTIVLMDLIHALRSPLGVVRGVLDDHLKGFELEEQDYHDALEAVERINEMLREVETASYQKGSEQH